MIRFASLAAAAAGLTLVATPLAAQGEAKTIEGTLTVFEGQKFDKRSYRVTKDDPDLSHDFLIGSIAVFPGEVWELCDKPKYKGNCLTVSADEAGIGKAVIKSVRAIKAKQ
ncbi:beta/gamma crystallin family protein [Sphingopyxis sp. PET50]|uniref:beta/gamma crystallin family protein n=1 Tax=Sphingopyxis sp. PET50 TaxID=2976533 RepID=UPI0021AEFF00|nr:beta/gamma crystallin family protein [Sphingopyxis sp. PET50]